MVIIILFNLLFSFWIGVLYCYFVLDQREEATVLLLQLRDNSLIEQDQAWGISNLVLIKLQLMLLFR